MDSFADGNHSANPTWSGFTTNFVVTTSDAGPGTPTPTATNTVRLNALATSANRYISTANTNAGTQQEWAWWWGRRSQAATGANAMRFFLYANEANLTSATVDGYCVLIGDDSGGDDLFLQRVDNGAFTTILTSSSSIANGATDWGLCVRVAWSNGNWNLYSSTIPGSGGGTNHLADPTVATTVSQGSVSNSAYTPTNGYLGLWVVHSTAAAAYQGVELDQVMVSNYQAAASSPEISIRGTNLAEIVSGDVTPDYADGTDFGALSVAGTLAVTNIFGITNSGTATLTISGVTTSSAMGAAADFVVVSWPATVLAGTQSNLVVKFDPAASGVRTALVTVANDDGDEGTYAFVVKGTGTAPEIAVSGNGANIANGDASPSTGDGTDYGNVLIGGSLDQTFVITNTGNATLNLGTVTTSGTHAAEFVVVTQPAATVAVSNSTTLVLRFLPGGSGVRSAAISFSTDDADENPFNFSVQGEGVSAAPSMQLLGTNLAVIALGDASPDAADGSDFTAAAVAGGTVSRTFTITNAGNASLTVSGVTTSGSHAAEFQVTTAPAGSVAAGATTAFVVQFDPADRGLRSATFSIANNDGPNNPYTFAVQGTGTAPEIAVSGNGVDIADGDATPTSGDHTDFGSADVDVGSVVRTFTVTNTGNATLTLGSVTVGGTHAADFTVTAALPGTLAVSNGTTFQVTFNPSATGVRSATLSFSTDDPDENPFNFSIQGTGTVAPEIAVLGTNGALVADGDSSPGFDDGTDFGATLVTGGTVDRTLFITNSGSGPLSITGVTTSGTAAVDFQVISWPSSVAAGTRSNLVLRFDPTASGVRTAAVVLANSDADEGTYDFAVKGTGQVPPSVTTTIASATNQTTATAGGNVTADGFAPVTNRGVVWGVSSGPTVPGAQTTNGTGTGIFSATLTNLTPGATYYYRAFAQNSAGTTYDGEYILTTPCIPGVVTGLYASATNTTSFTAAWSNFSGATGYALDVSTNATFSAGVGGNYGSEAFTNIGGGSSSSYLTRQWTNNGVAWTGFLARSDQTINGTAALTFQNASGSWLASQSITGGIGTLSFKHQRKFGTSGDTGGLDVFINAVKVATNVPYSDNVVTTVIPGLAVSGSFVITLTNATTAHRVAVDDVTWSNSGAVASYVPGYSNLAVAGTSQGVSGLDQGVTYYFRVRATNGYCITDNSSTGVVTTITTDAPEIAILGTNLALIADGDASPSLLDGSDFGDVSTVSTVKDHLFTVTNAGTATLTLSNIVISGAAAADYAVQTGLGASSLAPGEITTFTIRFDPSASGARPATITLANNDSDENPYNFDLTGNGVVPTPEIAVLGSNLVVIPDGDTTPSTADGTDFGSVSAASGNVSRTFTITNSGLATLTISGVTTSGAHAADFVVTTAPAGTVAAGSSTTFTVRFDPSAYGGRTGVVVVASDDSDEATYDFVVRGDGVITLAEALDEVSLVWTTRGSAVWFGQAPTNHDGTDAAQSGALGINNATSTLETVAFGPGTVDFWWQVSSEDGYDYLSFQVDGVEQDFITGAIPWSQTNFAISSGNHTLQWLYVKDVSASNGADAGWVDQATYTPAGPISGFSVNGSGTNLTDAQLSVAITVRVTMADADGINWNGSTISPTPDISPYLVITNPAGTQVVAPVAFTSTGHTDGELNTTVTGVVTVSSVTTGSPFKVSVVMADVLGTITTGAFSFVVADDDFTPPVVSSVTVSGVGGWSAGMNGLTTNINNGFENADGWADQAGGNWTETAVDGDWISSGCYANAGTTHGGTRKIGLNDVADALQLPPVDSPVTVSAWLRLSGAGSDTIRLEYKNGASWVTVSNQTVSSTTYSQYFWNLSNSGITTMRFYAVSAGNSFYLDDVQVLSGSVETWPKSVLTPGDIFINGFNADGNDDFSFLTFVDIAGSTEIRFTDYGWTNGTFTPNAEGTIIYSAPAGGLAAGSVVLLTNYSAGSGYGVNLGSATKSGSFDFSGSGDQLLAYQVAPGSTSFLFGLSTDSTNWFANSAGANYSEVPPGLVAGVTAIHANDDLGANANIDCGVASVVTGTPVIVRTQLLQAATWTFTETGPLALSAEPYTAGVVYDGALTNVGYGVTAMVYDAMSGIIRTGGNGARYSIIGADGTVLVNNSGLTNGLTADGAATSSTAISDAGDAIAPASITLGAYTALVYVADYDQDRTGDSLGATGRVWFTVRDDDTNAPAISAFRLNGASTNYDTGVGGNLIITGLLTDTLSPVFSGGYGYFLVRDAAGGVLASNALYAGTGQAATGTWVSPSLSCGLDYTVVVVAADSDLDRGTVDQSIGVATALVFHTTGVGGPSDYPTASNLLVNGQAAALTTTVSDATIRTGGWSLAMSMSHPVGVFTNSGSPSFRVTNVLGEVVSLTPWSNAMVSGQTIYFTNNNLPGATLGVVNTGVHYVVWSASNQGSCVASIVDRGVITGGTNVFAVVDDDVAAPALSGFTLGGGGATLAVTVASSGFAITGLIQDATSGVAFTSQPPYLLFYDVNGTVLASNLYAGTEGSGTTPLALTNWISGLTLACGNSYTVRVVAADTDADRVGDRATSTTDVLVVQTEGVSGLAPTAQDLLVNSTPATSATLFDEQMATGGWRVALVMTHSSGNLVTNGPNAPSFVVQNNSGTTVYAASPLSWSNITKAGALYYATNSGMPPAVTNTISTGRYSLVWSAQSDGLCYGLTNGSALVSPGTNTFLVVDDDVAPPVFSGLSVGGGTFSNTCGGGFSCPDPSRTNLQAGDIAIFAMNTKTRGTTNHDSFAFVTLVDVPTGTRIKFTDNGWKSSTASFRSGEGVITWQATNCVPAGTVVRWIATNTPVVNVGLIVATNGNFAPNIEGEQILAYQGSESSPNFIYAINDRLTGLWDVDAVDSHSSALPPGLADGYTAVAVGEFDNVIINTNNLALTGDRTDVLNYIGGQDNWIGSDEAVYDLLQFNFSFPNLCTSVGAISDQDVRLGLWSITGLVQDAFSGVAVSNGAGFRYVAMNTNGGVVASNYFVTTFGQGSKLLHAFSNNAAAGDYNLIQLGTHTVQLFAADADHDRPHDAAERSTNIPFTVVDDDVDFPQLGSFFINGQTIITNAAELTSVVISGQVRDVTSGIGFTSAPPRYEVLDSLGTVALAGYFDYGPTTEGAGQNWTNIWTTGLNLGGIADCGTYTVRVTVADADNDRVDDRRSTNLYFLISVASGNGSAPVASNLLVNSTPAGLATLTDAQLAQGGWTMALTFSHPSGLELDPPSTPTFELRDPADSSLFGQTWSNFVTAGTTAYATNYDLPPVAYGSVQTGYYSVVWSGRSQGGCFGITNDSAAIFDTNRFLVVDDDTTGPSAASNLSSSAAYWTNQSYVTYTWNTGSVSDASGVAHFRLTTNHMAPTSMVEGILVGLTNTVAITNLNEGITTNWLFAVDADNDRADDGAMGAATSVVVYLDFTPPDRVTNLVAQPGSFDDTSEIDLSWNALPDAGNSNLSPWLSYRVYYTQDGSDPTANDQFVDAVSYPTLATNSTSSLVLQGLNMGSEYRLAMAGVDRAGNIGPISGVHTVSLSQVIITQAFVNASGYPVLSWLGKENGFYDVIYADSTGFSAAVDSNWRLAQTVVGTGFSDTGGVDEGTGAVRLPPMEMPVNMMRFYRVASVNAWIPSSGRDGGATTQIIVALKTALSNGNNFVGMAMTPMINSLAEFLGTNRLPAGTEMDDSTRISVYQASATGQAQTNAWWLSATEGWRYELGSASANTQALPFPYSGFNLLLPTNGPSTNLLLVGRVPWTNLPSVTLNTGLYHVITMNTPRPLKVHELGLRDHLAWGNNIGNADEIRILNRGLGPYGSPRARIYVNTSGAYVFNTGGLASNYVIRADDAIIIHTKKLTTPVVWQPERNYDPPRFQITNAIHAAPTVVAQTPISITETSATLRGLVNPNRLITAAHIDYGLTTNYGSIVALTNLPATNAALQLSGPISGLATGTVYYFRIRGSNNVGVSRFGTGSFTTLGLCTGSIPASVSLSAGDGVSSVHVALSWVDGVGEEGYQVWRHTVNNSGGASVLGATAADSTSYNDATAVPGQTYYYWLKATNCAGSSTFGSGDDGFRKLATVTGVNASDSLYTNKVVVTWSDVTGETGFGLWRHTANVSGSATYLDAVAADVLTYDDTSAAPGVAYYYWIRATNTSSASQGDFSASDAGMRMAAGAPVLSAPTVTAITSSGATLGATVDSASPLPAERGTVWDTSASPTANEEDEGGTSLGAYSHARTGLPAGSFIYFRGWATNSAGKTYSPEGTFWTAPATPVIIGITAVNTNTFTIQWAASTGATNYLLDVSASASFTGYVSGYSNRVLGNVSSVMVTGLFSTSTNYWRLRAQNSGGTSTYTSTTNTLTLSPEPVTQAKSIFFTSVGHTSMKLNWTNGNGSSRMVLARLGGAVDGAPSDADTNYTASSVYGSGTQVGSSYVVYKGSSSNVTVTGLATNSSYFFRVFEYAGAGASVNYLTNSAAGNPAGQATLLLGCPGILVYPTTLPNGTNGNFFTTTMVASNGAAPYVFSITAGSLPPNLVLNSTNGVLSGTLVSPGTDTFSVVATDTNGCTGMRPYTFVTY